MIRATGLVLLTLLTAGAGVPATAATSDAPYPTASGSGRVEQLDFAGSTLIVEGKRYGIAVDVAVEIGGSYGAFTMLTEGMPVRFEYLQISPSERVMVRIKELPAGVQPEQS